MTTSTPGPDPRRWLALFLLCTAQFLVILDTSIVGIALPALQRALGFDAAGLQWIFSAYVVAFGGLLLLGGRLADLFGPRRLFATGFAILTAASLVAGLAQSATTLLVARAIQGVGAALVAPAALSMVMSLFGARPVELRKALGFWGASAAAGGTAGVFLGGVITEWLSWRWTFLVNVPVGVLVMLATTAWLPRGERRPGSVDLGGALAITASVALAVYTIVTANDATATLARNLGLLALSAALFAGFIVIQRARREPLVPPALLRAPNLAIGNVVMALLGAAWIPMWFFLNLYLQELLGYGAFASGLALLPMTLTIMLLMILATEKVVGRIGPKAALAIGLGTLGLALILFSRMPREGTFVADVLLPSLLGAVGMSLAYIPAMILSTMGARPEDGGLASGLVNTTYQVGSAIGLAAMVAATSGASTPHAAFSTAFVGAAAIAFVAAAVTLAAIRLPRRRLAAPVAVMLALPIALAACTSQRHDHPAHADPAPPSAVELAPSPPPVTPASADATPAPVEPAPAPAAPAAVEPAPTSTVSTPGTDASSTKPRTARRPRATARPAPASSTPAAPPPTPAVTPPPAPTSPPAAPSAIAPDEHAGHGAHHGH